MSHSESVVDMKSLVCNHLAASIHHAVRYMFNVLLAQIFPRMFHFLK